MVTRACGARGTAPRELGGRQRGPGRDNSLRHGKSASAKVSLAEEEGGRGEFIQRTHNPHWQEQKTREAGFKKLPYLFVGVRPVKAQEKVGGLAVQEEISCPKRDGKALDSVAEVKRDPEVLGISICKDVLQKKKGEFRAGLRQGRPTPCPQRCVQGRGPAGAPTWLPPSPGREETLAHTKQGSGKEGVQERLPSHQVSKLVKPIFSLN